MGVVSFKWLLTGKYGLECISNDWRENIEGIDFLIYTIETNAEVIGNIHQNHELLETNKN